MFFGSLDPTSLALPEKTMPKLPAGKALLPEGDFRDWDDIDAWAASIAADLGARQATQQRQAATSTLQGTAAVRHLCQNYSSRS